MHSHYSLRYGILTPKEVLEHIEQGALPYCLLCDVNNTSASLDFVRIAQKKGRNALVGVDFRNGATRKYLAIARNNEGFAEINVHLSEYAHEKKAFPDRAPALPNCWVIYPLYMFPSSPRENEYENVEPYQIPSYRLHNKHDRQIGLPTMTFRNKRDFNTHRLLRSIDNNVLLSKLPKIQEASPSDYYLHHDQVLEEYEEYPELHRRALELLERCAFEFEFGTEKPHENQQTYTGSFEEDDALIQKLAYDGLAYRYPDADEQIYNRLEKELHIIREKKFTSYFLINWDITSYARSKGYFYVGRGSGANSIVAYLLRITDVDPIELDLYFERFINLYRQNPPDFDIDFSWTDREDMTRYIFDRFDNVTLLGAYSTFQYRAVVRELGKVFGLPKHEIDVLTKGNLNYNALDDLSRLVIRYSERIHGFPNSLTIHAAGILITEKPITHYTATFLPPKGYPTTHFDMIIAEDAGLYKFDILSQRGLGKIKETLDIIRYNCPDAAAIDIHDMKRFKEDEHIKRLLRTADAIGCFYVESPAMRQLMKKLEVDDYLGLVAASSVIRPGVSRSGMMKEYILRTRNPERRKEGHPVMLDIMPETYGIMVYQEDVIKVAHYFAGLTLGEADVLRRGMSGKFRSREEFEKAKERFFETCRSKGHTDEVSAEVWRQIESFAGYAFAKGHSASYAVESYQSLFLKAYYPLEYMVATINNFGGFYSTEFYIHEARLKGAEIQEPCINRGRGDSVIFDDIIVLGFGLVKSVEHKTILRILEAREEEGPFTSLEEFVDRVPVGIEQLTLLIRCNAFRFTRKSKKELLWDAHLLLGHTSKKEPVRTLFRSAPTKYELPALFTAEHEDAFDQMELFGFPLADPFSLLREVSSDTVSAKDLKQYVGQKVAVEGYLVTTKLTSTAKKERMYFGTFVDREGEWLDTVHFPIIAKKYPFRGRGIYRVVGKVTDDFGCYAVDAEYMEKLPIIEDPRYAEVKAFEKKLIEKKKATPQS